MPSSLSPFLCFELLDECGEMRGDGDREGVVQAALVVGGAAIATRGAALIALRIAQPIRLRIEQGVQRLLHGAPHHPVEVALDPLVVNRDCGLGVSSAMAAPFC